MKTTKTTLCSFSKLSEEAKVIALECERYRMESTVQDKLFSSINQIFAEFNFDYDSIGSNVSGRIVFEWRKIPYKVLIKFAQDLMDTIEQVEFWSLIRDSDFVFAVTSGRYGPSVVVSGGYIFSSDTWCSPDSYTMTLIQRLKSLIQMKLQELVLCVNQVIRNDVSNYYSDEAVIDAIKARKVKYLASGFPRDHPVTPDQCKKIEESKNSLVEVGDD
jgi:hypothetical protein